MKAFIFSHVLLTIACLKGVFVCSSLIFFLRALCPLPLSENDHPPRGPQCSTSKTLIFQRSARHSVRYCLLLISFSNIPISPVLVLRVCVANYERFSIPSLKSLIFLVLLPTIRTLFSFSTMTYIPPSLLPSLLSPLAPENFPRSLTLLAKRLESASPT